MRLPVVFVTPIAIVQESSLFASDEVIQLLLWRTYRNKSRAREDTAQAQPKPRRLARLLFFPLFIPRKAEASGQNCCWVLAVAGEPKITGARDRSTACRRSSSSPWRLKPPRAPARFFSALLAFLPSSHAVSSLVAGFLSRLFARDSTRPRTSSTRARYPLRPRRTRPSGGFDSLCRC